MDTQSENQKPVDLVKQSSPETEGAATTALLLEMIFGFFGLLGMGHIYSGRTALGIALMIGWWVYIGISIFVSWTIFGLFLLICGSFGLGLPIISGIQAR